MLVSDKVQGFGISEWHLHWLSTKCLSFCHIFDILVCLWVEQVSGSIFIWHPAPATLPPHQVATSSDAAGRRAVHQTYLECGVGDLVSGAC